MAALCLDSSLETFSHSTIVARTISRGSSAAAITRDLFRLVQVVVTLSASRVLQNSPQFIVLGVEVWAPREPILGTDKCWNMPPQSLMNHLDLVGGS